MDFRLKWSRVRLIRTCLSVPQSTNVYPLHNVLQTFKQWTEWTYLTFHNIHSTHCFVHIMYTVEVPQAIARVLEVTLKEATAQSPECDITWYGDRLIRIGLPLMRYWRMLDAAKREDFDTIVLNRRGWKIRLHGGKKIWLEGEEKETFFVYRLQAPTEFSPPLSTPLQ